MTARKPGLLLIGLAYLGFISLGLPDGLLGVAAPSIRSHFGIPIDALGALLVTFAAGYIVASFSSGRILARMSVGTLLALSCLATGVSLIGYALAPAWWVMVACGALAGLGAGAIDAGINTYFATQLGSARTLNWLHGCWGIGATGGPIIMTAVLSRGLAWQWGYALVGAGQLVLALGFAATRPLWVVAPHPAGKPVEPGSARAASTLRMPAAWLGIAVFFVYTGVEAVAGIWVYSLFTESRGIAAATAGIWVSAYWGSLTVGRLVLGAATSWISVRVMLRLCIATVAACAALIWLAPSTPISLLALPAMGFALAPVFPSLIATTPARLGAAHTANGVGFQIAGAVSGQSLLPALVGILAGRLGFETIGPALFVSALALLALHEALLAAGSAAEANRTRAADRAPIAGG